MSQSSRFMAGHGASNFDPPKKMSRGDIQGLRALAVIVVILDHMFGWPHGGFVGVDIFFVISGFLITGQLMRQWEREKRISFTSFYRKRVKRILPASLLTLICTVTASYLIFNASRFQETLIDGVWATAFAANWRFGASGTDYFQQGGAISPLQHFWSLAVEEQFYFVWPWLMLAVLVATARRATSGRIPAGLAIALLSLLSFGWALHETSTNASLAYFSTFSRVWELGLGALLAIITPVLLKVPQIIRPALAWLGLVLMVGSVFLVNEESGFPAPSAVYPVLGAGLVILAGVGARDLRTLGVLTNPVSRYIGDVSFSLYLWHFPVIILGQQLVDMGSLSGALTITAVSVVLAVFSYHLVEDPIRKSDWLELGRKPKRGPMSDRYKYILVGFLATLTMATTALVYTSTPAPVVAQQNDQVPVPVVNAAADSVEVLPELESLRAELASGLSAASWPELAPSFEDVLNGGQAPQHIAVCGHKEDPVDVGSCTWGNLAGENKAVIVGDSTSLGYVEGLTQTVASLKTWSITSLGTFGCSFRASQDADPSECDARFQGANAAIRELQPDVLFVTNANLSKENEDQIADAISAVEESVGKVVYLMPPPADKILEECYNKVSSPSDCISVVNDQRTTKASWQRASAQMNGWHFVNSDDWFCIDKLCPAFAGATVTKKDLNHATPAYQVRIGRVMVEYFAETDIFAS